MPSCSVSPTSLPQHTCWQSSCNFQAPELTPSSSKESLLPHTLQEVEYACHIANLEEELCNAKSQWDAATTHAVLSAQELSILKHKYNKKAEKKDGSRQVVTDARVLMSWEGKEQAAADAAKKAAKKKAEADRKEKQRQAEHTDIIRHADQEQSSSTFTGSLTSKSKSALIDICFALNLLSDNMNVDALCA
ncbi:hypothetical protein GYMLUDRAFT_246820 [Collybiopsis luxurians FD-317 M1]|uniref:Uncharacterized protein n=1 Tax=Collybiopsis luxurians FD-317 M1 TaxID=944289 RepID=A0A0D0B2U4_9AGAR|nr:hypothetical protein GYMLUDRAFT_246820 [Collybiopsis luxurians FD-317 M1]